MAYAKALMAALLLTTSIASPFPSGPSNPTEDEHAVQALVPRAKGGYKVSHLSGATVRGDDEEAPAGTIFPRDSVPSYTSSTDGKFTVWEQCDNDNDQVTEYFLFNTDFGDKAQDICNDIMNWKDASQQNDGTKLVDKGKTAASTNIQRARVKVAANIWHKGSNAIDTTMNNIALEPTAENKKTAFGLCVDAVNYHHDQCFDPIQGLVGSSPHVNMQYKAAKDGSVVFRDVNTKMDMISFGFHIHPH